LLKADKNVYPPLNRHFLNSQGSLSHGNEAQKIPLPCFTSYKSAYPDKELSSRIRISPAILLVLIPREKTYSAFTIVTDFKIYTQICTIQPVMSENTG